MELIKGPSLKQRMSERGKLMEDQAVIMLWQVGHALRYAWNHGVLHRDVKPANLMLAPPRPGIIEPFCAKVCDFGLAKLMIQDGPIDDESKGMLTGAGMALGTPHYMPPEQASGQIDLDQRADIYSLAASVYHALLGQTMHHGKSTTIIMYKQVTQSADLDPLRALGISDGMVQLMGRMLEKSRKRRFNTWDEVLNGVKALAPGLVEIPEQPMGTISGSSADLVSPVASASADASAWHKDSADNHPNPPPKPAPTASLEPAPTASPKPVPPQPREQTTRKRSLRPWILVAVMSMVIVVAITAWSALRIGYQGHRVSPATFAVVLASIAQQDQRTLLLEPGDYPGPWRFGASHVGVTIRALDPGVRVIGAGLAHDVPLVRFESGLTDFTLIDVEIVNADGLAVEAFAGARATMSKCVVSGQIAAHGAHLMLRDLTLRGGVLLDLLSTVKMEDSVVIHQPAISLRDGRAEVVCSRLVGGGPGAVVQVLNGQLDLDTVVVDPQSPADVGLELGAIASATLRDVVVQGVAIGVRSEGARVHAINGLSINATETGLWWQGQRDPAWSWERLQFQAPKPVEGLELLSGHEGARPERTGLVPPRR